MPAYSANLSINFKDGRDICETSSVMINEGFVTVLLIPKL